MGTKRWGVVTWVIVALGCAAFWAGAVSHGQVSPAEAARARLDGRVKELETQISSGNPELQQKAVASLKAWFAGEPSAAAEAFGRLRFRLWDVRRYHEVLECIALIQAQPRGEKEQGELNDLKARCLLALGKHPEAVALWRENWEKASGQIDDWWGFTGMRLLLEGKRYADVVSVGDQILCAKAYSVEIVENCLRCQITALRVEGKHAEALAKAKSFYNVCTMAVTAEALQLIARELRQVHPEDRSLLTRFEQEQIAGAEIPTTTAPATAKALGILASIKVDAKAYEPGLQGMPEENLRALTRRGNLLLLADRAPEAAPVLERAYSLAELVDLRRASESIARCMKAQDGTVGRANAWIVSLNPENKAK